MSCEGVHCAQVPVTVSHTGPSGDDAQSELLAQRVVTGTSASGVALSSPGGVSFWTVASGGSSWVPGEPSAQPNASAAIASAARREASERRGDEGASETSEAVRHGTYPRGAFRLGRPCAPYRRRAKARAKSGSNTPSTRMLYRKKGAGCTPW